MEKRPPPPPPAYSEEPLPGERVTHVPQSVRRPLPRAEPVPRSLPEVEPVPRSLQEVEPVPRSQAQVQPVPHSMPHVEPPIVTQPAPQDQIGFVPAQAYQPFPGGPIQLPTYPLGSSTVVIQSSVQPHVRVGRDRTFVRCPTCKTDVMTDVRFRATTRTHIYAAIMCMFAMFLCAWIPYCMDSCKSCEHYCPICNSFIGRA